MCPEKGFAIFIEICYANSLLTGLERMRSILGRISFFHLDPMYAVTASCVIRRVRPTNSKFRVCCSELALYKPFRLIPIKALCSSLSNIPSECSCSINQANTKFHRSLKAKKQNTKSFWCPEKGFAIFIEICSANSLLTGLERTRSILGRISFFHLDPTAYHRRWYIAMRGEHSIHR